MESITAYRSHISDRFPVASFAVCVPEERAFEVACATDPRLFQREQQRNRTARNFYSTRMGGPLRAPRGETTWILPSAQLRRFAGAPRIYYALASYGRGGARDVELSLPGSGLAPSISLAGDFTGRTLDRSRLLSNEPASDVYGSPRAGVLEWLGDAVLGAPEETSDSSSTESETYDDGYGPMSADEGEQERESVDPGDDPDARTGVMALADEGESECHDDEPDPSHAYRGEGTTNTECEEGAECEAADATQAAQVLAADRGDEDCSDADQTDDPAAYGSGASAALEAETGAGRDSDYAEHEDSATDAASAAALAVVSLDIPEKVRLLRIVQRFESGDGYSGVSRDAEYNDPRSGFFHKTHIGLSWGFIQFTQRSGGIGAVLTKAREREQRLRAQNALKPELFLESLFGPDFEELLRVTNAATDEARVAPVAGAALWDEPWVSRFRAAGRVDYVQFAQNEVAIRNYLDPIAPFARCLDLVTPRGLTMLLDRCTNMGVFGGLRFVSEAIGPIDGARRADALKALGAADLRAFQQRFASQLRADGQWGPKTHIAMVGALRALGAASPVQVPTREETIAAMVRAAAGKRYERRVRELAENRTDFDDTVAYDFV